MSKKIIQFKQTFKCSKLQMVLISKGDKFHKSIGPASSTSLPAHRLLGPVRVVVSQPSIVQKRPETGQFITATWSQYSRQRLSGLCIVNWYHFYGIYQGTIFIRRPSIIRHIP